jgi:transcription-repair coupling factor (superfamily II helicase)
MSLVGIRSLSLITTPPINRFPIQTYVVEENNALIKDAIYKELARGGQVFILYNHVDLIEHKVYEIQSLVPEAKIIFAHGRMNRDEIENKMMDFIDHKADILVCTTIIETGIDIPNVNTLIILEADHFGLSQLYQIRGRVGRSDKIAYAYMMYKPGKVLGEEAIKRLKTIEEFTELGSGFKIANRDLSIRGAGDILGEEQAGFIDSVGIDLYLKILNDEVKRIKGEEVEEETNEPPLLNIATHINDDYVNENELKIEIHKLINTIDSYDKLKDVKAEIEDRFGKIDYDMEIYMYEEWFDKIARRAGVIKVNQTSSTVEIIFNVNKSQSINGEKLFMSAYNISPYFKFNYRNKCLGITLNTTKLVKHYIFYLIKLISENF